jgi:hypothetical protein
VSGVNRIGVFLSLGVRANNPEGFPNNEKLPMQCDSGMYFGCVLSSSGNNVSGPAVSDKWSIANIATGNR